MRCRESVIIVMEDYLTLVKIVLRMRKENIQDILAFGPKLKAIVVRKVGLINTKTMEVSGKNICTKEWDKLVVREVRG